MLETIKKIFNEYVSFLKTKNIYFTDGQKRIEFSEIWKNSELKIDKLSNPSKDNLKFFKAFVLNEIFFKSSFIESNGIYANTSRVLDYSLDFLNLNNYDFENIKIQNFEVIEYENNENNEESIKIKYPKIIQKELDNLKSYRIIGDGYAYFNGSKGYIVKDILEYWISSFVCSKFPELKISKHLYIEPNNQELDDIINSVLTQKFGAFLKLGTL